MIFEENKLIRIFFLPLGFLKKCVEFANHGARDLQNQLRYKQSKIDNSVIISVNSTVHKNCHILQGSILNSVILESYSYINKNCVLQNVNIGRFCSIATNVQIGLGNHPTNLLSTSTLFYKKKNTFGIELIDKDINFSEYKTTFIGHDVWIGSSAIILDGVEVGLGAIIAAGAIVTKDVPPYAVVAGVPARIIKYRFSDEQIQILLESKWWEKEPQEILRLEILK
jgi:chloramphenicol O-acetyltransferase type B